MSTIASVAVATVGWAILIWMIALAAPLVAAIVGALVTGFTILFFLLPFVPTAIGLGIQKPDRYRPKNAPGITTTREYPPSKFGFFIYPHPGRVFVIERGGRFVRAMMSYPHRMFRGEIRNPDNDPDGQRFLPNEPEYWEIVKTPDGEHDTHPLPFPSPENRPWFWIFYSPLSILFWIWKRFVFKVTGAAFTGIPPFQGPRVYPMERNEEITLESGETELVRVEDYSNHYRVAHFQYPVKIANVDTYDKIPVRVMLNLVAHVYNPFMTAYETDDDWTTRFSNLAKDATTGFARSRPLTEVWTAAKGKTRELAKRVRAFGLLDTYKEALRQEVRNGTSEAEPGETPDTDAENPTRSQSFTCAFGIVIDNVNILDISPMDPKDTEKLGDVARAQVRMEAAQLDAKGAVAITEETARIIKENENMLRDIPHAAQILGMETSVRIAQAAGTEGNLVYITGGTSQASDPNQALALQELRRLRRQNKRLTKESEG
ncbi:hypothetical protein A2419_00370 [Candidatus Adlerbacteria bacterium RIFOXYC1_FULL_48_26]|uniref:Band 7 domain-containing protein n=1 Tax=Candidatus Adlerbacteria bacterium RIFOXYC1_FULL_48_26 TaxID=1797247 RepID=A0A1F4Y4T2_9BACT|nr:MAG: hypothetical protein A2419_00370 [Candidatus Adlerbacteria bacterium RIFOXYC1_FULL_48_26]